MAVSMKVPAKNRPPPYFSHSVQSDPFPGSCLNGIKVRRFPNMNVPLPQESQTESL
jgi:hypothetical protein